jgi:polysaccharide export outer membrane protein
MRLGRLFCLLLLALAIGGCARSGRPVGYAAAPAAYGYAAPAFAAGEPYQLDSGDKLRITVFGQEGLTNTYLVDAAGNITISLIGPVQARGLTTMQLAAALTERLKQGYIRNPHVSVEIDTYRPFFILGEVTAPGQYPFVANMTVETAVAIAGGYSPRALKSGAQLTRNFNGQPMRSSVPPNFQVRPGDTITIGERWF